MTRNNKRKLLSQAAYNIVLHVCSLHLYHVYVIFLALSCDDTTQMAGGFSPVGTCWKLFRDGCHVGQINNGKYSTVTHTLVAVASVLHKVSGAREINTTGFGEVR